MSKKSPPQGTPLMRQYEEVKRQYSDAIVLFRMGDFYETFSDDAVTTAKVLGIVLTKRSNGAAADVPLAGFPYHAIDNYLHKLVNAGHRVAICEQVEDPKLAKGIVKREVVEVVTPGTITSEAALNEKANQFLACVHTHRDNAGYAVLDQSTGELFIGECPEDGLTEALGTFAPREVLLAENVVYSTAVWYRELKPFVSTVEDWVMSFDQGDRTLTDHFNVRNLKGFGCGDLELAITAAGAIFYHIKNALNGSLAHVTSIHPVSKEGIMGLDGFTIRNLEVFKSLSTQGTHGTLIDLLDETVTNGGGRLVKQWLSQPLTDIEKLNDRLDIVAGFVKNKRLLKKVRTVLDNVMDIERILGKISQNKANPRDIIGLKESLKCIPKMQELLNSADIDQLNSAADSFADTAPVVELISEKLNEEVPAQLQHGHVFRDGINKELDELRKLASGGKQWIAEMQESEREKTGISKLKVGFNKVFGYYLEISKIHQDKVPESYIRKQTLVNAERYITEELKEYEEKILSAEEDIIAIESELFSECCQKILDRADRIQINAKRLNRLDVLSTFSHLSIQKKYCKPSLVADAVLDIKDGRHPVVENLLPASDRFVGNDLKMNVNKSQIHLITGPNMAGKSTYLRQVGLIVLMAQVGCYVPAKKATIGIVDRLFTRVGASDNLAGGESTFLVEMIEAANILNNATAHSLILLDEIGRGTATFDGLSLAWSITEYLHNRDNVAARTLFATHYHELTELEHSLDRLENHHAAVKEFGDEIVFLKKIMSGPGDRSYGIHVAQMAGLPTSVISRAKDILSHHLESSDQSGTSVSPPASKQISMFEQQEAKFKKDLDEMDVNSMTPIQALQKLDELKKKHGL
ncbi:MAG: DNA mismatch repair protein MutS [Candidatus Marinimicrobia bacterium]|nr:DNA mismatch repair protein MutS [Candidatus Neomarinimicrobiota bacterium]MDP6726231.1 DNA mismatch repair protein MutS [Candidatus Neomarinimicrobiota bacterium]